MAQYQSFPDAPGDSRTLDKLVSLKLPDLEGRSFLDVGCNEGFFCGFAHFAGGMRSVGIDHSRLFIERARQRFPACEFRQQGWDELPDGDFDVILLASALHYADDQAALLQRLVDKLSPSGVLVLELGIAPSQENEWVTVQRGDDSRLFPSMQKLEQVLGEYAWKWMGRSVSQDGDPVARHVVHISRRRPTAYLLMQPPAYGKSSIARQLFVPAGIPVVSGDEQLGAIARGSCKVSAHLRRIVQRDFSPFRIDQVVQRVFEAGAGEELVQVWVEQGGRRDFALDAYVPGQHHAEIESTLAGLGYMPVLLNWQRVGPRLVPAQKAGEQAQQYYLSMAAPGTPRPKLQDPFKRFTTGYVDDLALDGCSFTVRGWALDAEGQLPTVLGVRLGARTIQVDAFDKQSRPDVQRHLQLEHPLVGFRFQIDVDEATFARDLAAGFQVFVPDTGALRLAGGASNWLLAKAAAKSTDE